MMDSDEGKLFVGGIPWNTTEKNLQDYFSKYGDIARIFIPRDYSTGRPRGYGFVFFLDPTVLDCTGVLKEEHFIGGKQVGVKRALPKGQYLTSIIRNHLGVDSRIYVRGLSSRNIDQEELHRHFKEFGEVTDVVLIYDQNNNKRGYGFIYFATEDAVEKALAKNIHYVQGNCIEVKRAHSLNENRGVNAGRTPGGGGALPDSVYSSPVGAYGSYGIGGYGNASVGPYGIANTSNTVMPSYGASGYGGGTVLPASIGQPMETGYGGAVMSTDANPGGASGVTYLQTQTTAPDYTYGGYGLDGYGNADVEPYGASGVNAGGAYDSQVTYLQSQTTAAGYPYSGYSAPDYRYGGAYGGYGLDGYGNAGVGPYGNLNTSNTLYGASGYGDPNFGYPGGSWWPYLQQPMEFYGYLNLGGSGYGESSGNSGYQGGSWRPDPPQFGGDYGSGYDPNQQR